MEQESAVVLVSVLAFVVTIIVAAAAKQVPPSTEQGIPTAAAAKLWQRLRWRRWRRRRSCRRSLGRRNKAFLVVAFPPSFSLALGLLLPLLLPRRRPVLLGGAGGKEEYTERTAGAVEFESGGPRA